MISRYQYVESSSDLDFSTSEEVTEEDSNDQYKLSLIEEVRGRPALWDNQHPEFFNRPVKDRLWDKIYSILRKGDLCRNQEHGEDVRKTWKNIKDCHTRCVARLRKGEKGRRYRYYQQLKFLRKNAESSNRKRQHVSRRERFETPENGGGIQRPSKRSRKETTPKKKSTGNDSTMLDDAPSRPPGNDPPCQEIAIPGTSGVVRSAEQLLASPSRLAEMQFSIELAKTQLLEVLKHTKQEPDEDRDFASSLVPMLRELDYDQKHFAKKNILKVMKNAKYLQLDGSVDLPRPHKPESDGHDRYVLTPLSVISTPLSPTNPNQSDESDNESSGNTTENNDANNQLRK